MAAPPLWMVFIDIVKLRLYRRMDEFETRQTPWLSTMKHSLDGLGNLHRRA
jgi:hypothetical protein